MYAIRINKTGRFVRWVDECWYETSNTIVYPFNSIEQCKLLAKLFKNHYVYSLTAIDEDGNEIDINEKVEVKKKVVNDDFFGELF